MALDKAGRAAKNGSAHGHLVLRLSEQVHVSPVRFGGELAGLAFLKLLLYFIQMPPIKSQPGGRLIS